MDAVNDKDAVLQAHAQNHAIAALVAAKPSCITNARFDRGELTLWIERDDIRPVCRTLQKAGYNFLADLPGLERQVTPYLPAAVSRRPLYRRSMQRPPTKPSTATKPIGPTFLILDGSIIPMKTNTWRQPWSAGMAHPA